jgi:hypothetical protein
MAVQEQAQQTIAPVMVVDLVTMAKENPLTLYRNDSRTGVYLRPEPLTEHGTQMEIMVAFEVYKATAATHQRLKCSQHFIKLAERIQGETQPEVEQVTHNKEGFRIPLEFAEKP